MARPIGDGGVSTISSAAGRKAELLAARRSLARSGRKAHDVRGPTLSAARAVRRAPALADFMDPCLQAIQTMAYRPPVLIRCVVRAILDQAAAVEGDDAIGRPRPPRGDAR